MMVCWLLYSILHGLSYMSDFSFPLLVLREIEAEDSLWHQKASESKSEEPKANKTDKAPKKPAPAQPAQEKDSETTKTESTRKLRFY
jgi:hypothetical protein